MEFKPGDKVRRLSAYQYLNGWPWGGEVKEVKRVTDGPGLSLILKDCGRHYDCWKTEYFELDTGPNAAQLAATAKFDGQPQPDAAKTVKLKGDLLKVFEVLKSAARPLTLYDIAARAGVPQISVGSRVRDLRKPKFGGYSVIRHKASRDHVYLLAKVAA